MRFCVFRGLPDAVIVKNPMNRVKCMPNFTNSVPLQDERLALIHIPLDLYPFFAQPLLQLIFHEVPAMEERHEVEDGDDEAKRISQPVFLNLSVTPVECSVVCARHLAELYFEPLVRQFDQAASTGGSRVSISKEDFIVMQVEGQGLDAGQRVLELTSPLAMAGISIFFISTYFSDYILVPLRSKGQVVKALEKRGFTFEVSTEAFVNNSQSQYGGPFSPISPPGPTAQRSPPNTPPPSTLSELQHRTFSSLRKHNIVPRVDESLRLVQCAAHHRWTSDTSSFSLLRPALTTALLVDKPRFLSLTSTTADPAASLLLEKRLLPRFSLDPVPEVEPDDENSLLLGSKEDILVPIMLDLRDLPLEATGIVCGLAGRLAAATHNREDLSNSHASISSLAGSTSALPPASMPIPMPSTGTSPTTSAIASSASHPSGAESPPSSHHLEPGPETYADAVEISFLSTVRAGTVIVGERELSRAVDALEAESREPDDEVVGEEPS
ncbi:hypothetical protein ANI_1_644084 [Paecilomyces variotii No. 5]|uniref:CASTOR ACT domain-containing protein n=1 Tax=Byssochlamys spectabilis (strain No. 5 / NBRC 109023) TaxID=1356009 RepID=V5HV61_BYSSN|nr:hypothetical protein ANI_1_644084 [Paecilomyces variotii No. 5]